jgi:hypothetical protein
MVALLNGSVTWKTSVTAAQKLKPVLRPAKSHSFNNFGTNRLLCDDQHFIHIFEVWLDLEYLQPFDRINLPEAILRNGYKSRD